MSIASKEALPYLVVMTSLDERYASHVYGIVPDRWILDFGCCRQENISSPVRHIEISDGIAYQVIF